MELSCAERLSAVNEDEERIGNEWQLPSQHQPRTAPDDHFMNWDPRVLANLLQTELTSVPSCDYFHHVQDDLQPFMRKVVTTWMLEVCEEQSCEEQVFPLSICLLDRFLCLRAVPRCRLQLLACAALLVASKVKQTSPLSVPLLVAYTDNSITPQELVSWEILLVQLLQWRVSAVTTFDFVELLLARTCCGPARTLLRRHAHTLAALCYTETDFMRMKPSLIATACVVSAVRGISSGNRADVVAEAERLASSACNITSLCPVLVTKVVQHIDQLMVKETTPQTSHKTISPPATPTSQPTTPKHVDDVIF